MAAEEERRLDPDEARSAAFDFATFAGERAITLKARCKATKALVRAERAAALTLLRFASNEEQWLAVEIVVRTVDDRRAALEACSHGAGALVSSDRLAADLRDVLADAGIPLSSR